MPALISQGKLYRWPRPVRCPRCGGARLWGHGYVPRYFDESPQAVWVKRWRCADCRAVHTLRPDTHWRRFWTAIAVMVRCVVGKLEGAPWPKDVIRQRQQYWWGGYRIQSLVGGNPATPLSLLLESGIMAVTHSLTDRAVHLLSEVTYRRLAATGPPGRP